MLNEYRCKLRADDNGPDGQKVVMKRVQAFANKVRPQSLLVRCLIVIFVIRLLTLPQGPINVHSVNLGTSAPRLSNARVVGDPVCPHCSIPSAVSHFCSIKSHLISHTQIQPRYHYPRLYCATILYLDLPDFLYHS